MRTFGWEFPFPDNSWSEIAAFYAEYAAASGRHLGDLAANIRDSPSAGSLAGLTSMHDLVVAARPLSDPPLDVIVVRAPSSLRPPKPGHVVIVHQTHTGHNDEIERPVEDTVRLFWRFSIEKFGIGGR